jgi:hypothetical protein
MNLTCGVFFEENDVVCVSIILAFFFFEAIRTNTLFWCWNRNPVHFFLHMNRNPDLPSDLLWWTGGILVGGTQRREVVV